MVRLFIFRYFSRDHYFARDHRAGRPSDFDLGSMLAAPNSSDTA
jgi:hypothetical protein